MRKSQLRVNVFESWKILARSDSSYTQFHSFWQNRAGPDVNGANTAPIYRFLKSAAPGILGTDVVKWNFTKFLVDKTGKVIKRYAPTDSPESIGKDLESIL
jgi:glutathione peroxidase-family protein